MYIQIGSPKESSDVVDLLLKCHERIRTFIGLACKLGKAQEPSVDEIRDAASRVSRYFSEALPLHVADEEESILPRLAGRNPEPDLALANCQMSKLRSRSKVPTLAKAVDRIRERGGLLVFPINSREEPRSLWSEFFPGTKMVWDWNEDGDMRVAEMWQLIKLLSDSSEVVYSKWYQGRATFFSRELFASMLAVRRRTFDPRRGLSSTAKTLLEVLENQFAAFNEGVKACRGPAGQVQ
jgi:hypothetical protein